MRRALWRRKDARGQRPRLDGRTTPAARRAGMPAAGRRPDRLLRPAHLRPALWGVSRRRDLSVDGEGTGRGRGLPTGASARRTAADEVPAAVPGAAGRPLAVGAGVPGEPAAVERTVALVWGGDAGPGLPLPCPFPLRLPR